MTSFPRWCAGLSGMMFAGAVFCSAEEPEYRPEIRRASPEAERAISRFNLPEGFQAEVVAAEPMLANPVAFDIDEKGRFFVAETFRLHAGVSDNRRHMDWLVDDLASKSVEDHIAYHREKLGDAFAEWEIEHDRLRMLTDQNGDGKIDSSTVFADGFKSLADGLASGVLARNGDIYFTCIPDLWLLRDPNGDGVAEERKSLSHGYGIRTSFLGHDLHGLILGPDGRLYFSIGDRGFNVATPNGRIVSTESGAVLRCRPDGSDLEIVHTGLRNPQELAFNEFGDLFTCDNNSDSGDKARIVQIAEGGDSGWRMPFQYIESPTPRGPWNEEKIWEPRNDAQPAYILPPITNFADGPSGLAYNPGIGLDASFDRSFLLADFRGGDAISGIRHFRLEPDGAFHRLAGDGIFLWKIVATDVAFGYDGCIYALDWVEGWDKPGKGRIYRFYHPEQRAAGKEVASLVAAGIENLPETVLISLLEHRDMRVRQRAQFALASRPAAAESLLVALARDQAKPILARIHAIWALGQIGEQKPACLERVLPLLTDGDAEIRAQAARVLGNDRFQPAYDGLIRALTDDSARVRFQAARGLGRLGRVDAALPLLAFIKANDDQDLYLRHAAVYSLSQLKHEESVLSALDEGQPMSIRRAALLVLRYWRSPRLADFLQEGASWDTALAEEAARAVYDLPIAEALPDLARLAGRSDLSNTIRRRAVFAAVRLGTPEDAKRVAAVAADGRERKENRLAALDALVMWDDPPVLDPVTGEYRPMPAREAGIGARSASGIAAEVLASPDRDLRLRGVELAGVLKSKSVESQLVEIFRDDSEQAKLRSAALSSLASIGANDLTNLIQEGLSDQRSTVRSRARQLMSEIDPAAALEILAGVLESGSIEEKQQAFATVGAMPAPEADQLLMTWADRLGRGEVEPALRVDLRAALRKRTEAALAKKFADLEAERAEIADPVARYQDVLVGGEADAGAKVFFEKTAAACLRCHKIGGRGGEVGPDLSNVGATSERRAILESIVDPNRKITKGFDSVVLILNDGRSVTGVLREETDTSITLIDAEAKLTTIDKEDIDERQLGKSAMPDDAVTKLTETELRDLVEFLATRKSP